MVRRSIAVLIFCLGTMFIVPGLASATDSSTIIEEQHRPPTAADGWQSANCTSETPLCSPETPNQYFTQAGGHPAFGFTQYIIQHTTTMDGREPIKAPKAARTIKTLHVELPAGLTVNPLATERCPIATFKAQECGAKFPGSQVGYEEATLVTNIPIYPGAAAGLPEIPGILEAGDEEGTVIPPIAGFNKVPVYGLVPNPGEPALNGFIIAGSKEVYLETDVAWQSDYHESFTIKMPEAAPQPDPPFSTLVSRQVSVGTAGNGTYITNPTTCFNPEEPQFETTYSTLFKAESYAEPDPIFPLGTSAVPTLNPPGVRPTGCTEVPFNPTVKVAPGTSQIDSPAPAVVTTEVPFENPAEGGSGREQSQVKSVTVKLPEGMGLNPSGSVGLQACSDAQFKRGVRVYDNECSASSVIGTAEIESPPLEKNLTGKIYVGEQKSSNPSSGEEFRILVEAKEPNEGIDVRLLGNVSANPATGQLTATFNEREASGAKGLPQVPFEAVTLKFDSAKSVLTSPPICSKAETTGALEPWARPGTTAPVSSAFTPSAVPGGGTCPTTLAARKFAPTYAAGSDSTAAGKYSPFRIRIARTDGQQELKAVNVTLPKGLTAKLAGIPYCSDAALAAASGTAGKAEIASPSCSTASEIGTSTTTAGSGTTPVSLGGHTYLAGPYKGAPLSLAIITPAVSGPFDLGTVVVRVALNVNPLTAQINAVSDLIPNVFGGVKLDIRNINVDISRSKFMVNPTNCSAQATAGTIYGGGADPANPAAFSGYSISAPFQATGCKKLSFKPKLFTRLYGPTKRNKYPRIRAILTDPSGGANVARTALTLPHSLFLEQGHIGTVCTRVQLAAQACPKNAIYGHAEAKSPLLENKLKGPVYLVSSNHTLPDLVADLRGQVNIQLHGVISSKRGGLKTVFNSVPDVPVSKFILNMRGGKKSLLVNSTNTCAAPQLAVLNIKGQNGKKVVNNKYPLNISSCQKSKGKKNHKK